MAKTGRRLSEEHKRKISEGSKRAWQNPETKRKLSNSLRGNKYALGYKHTEETRKKVSESHRGRVNSAETREKISNSRKGKPHPHKGRTFSDQERNNLSEKLKGRPGTPLTVEQRKKLSDALKGKPRPWQCGKNNPMYGRDRSGQKAPAWLGGKSFEPYCPKFNEKIKERVRDIFARRCYLCAMTEKENGRKLDVHHVDYNKSQGCNGQEWGLIPLCLRCHIRTNHNRWHWFALLRDYWIYEHIEFFKF